MSQINKQWEIFDNKTKAIHYALWLNFKYRREDELFSVVIGPENNFAVCQTQMAKDMFVSVMDDFTDVLKNLSYDELSSIASDYDPLPFWEDIRGMFSTKDNHTLMLILDQKIPLEKIIRFELAGREYDENNIWVGYDKAKEIWLESEHN